ncbi:MAG: hypothetical protein AB7S81_03340 [Bdellovibrionales bacterium]
MAKRKGPQKVAPKKKNPEVDNTQKLAEMRAARQADATPSTAREMRTVKRRRNAKTQEQSMMAAQALTKEPTYVNGVLIPSNVFASSIMRAYEGMPLHPEWVPFMTDHQQNFVLNAYAEHQGDLKMEEPGTPLPIQKKPLGKHFAIA